VLFISVEDGKRASIIAACHSVLLFSRKLNLALLACILINFYNTDLVRFSSLALVTIEDCCDNGEDEENTTASDQNDDPGI